jgi:GTPase
MVDVVYLRLKAGDGGNGRISFLRQKFRPKGGPDGGKGGRGGDLILEVDPNLNTLQHLSGITEFVSPPGETGGKAQSTGRDGEPVVVKVPSGTKVWLLAENEVAAKRRTHQAREGAKTASIHPRRLELPVLGAAFPLRPPSVVSPVNDQAEALLEQGSASGRVHARTLQTTQLDEILSTELVLMEHPGQQVVIARGGEGGRGNVSFKAADRTTPLVAEFGVPGEERLVVLELQLLADVGLVGFPNAGKSTFLSRVTRANPKIANYPFTTLEPQLGVMRLVNEREVVVADLPGIIEGAHEGKGLGLAFLRHIAACKVLVFVLSPQTESGELLTDAAELVTWLESQYHKLRAEITEYRAELAEKPFLTVISKCDLLDAELVDAAIAGLQSGVGEVLSMSAATGVGMNELSQRLGTLIESD